ncbi:MAG: hypothetical protein JRI45_10025 [Deltaproteobacteria bacterium]|nr:hypothetical protein [Deltaproteobacteria bacterium]MBW2068693.1 hypothetical protein [Deltaproteobacteria bacterium]
MKRMVCNNKGVVLITTLILSIISLLLVAVLMELVLTGAKLSGVIKRYTSALEAAKGGVEDFIADTSFEHKGNPLDSDFSCKVQNDTTQWPVSCANYDKCSGCSSDDISSCPCVVHSNPKDVLDNYDWSRSYGSYTVYCKIVDTRGTPESWLYTIDIVAKGQSTSELAWITILYLREY